MVQRQTSKSEDSFQIKFLQKKLKSNTKNIWYSYRIFLIWISLEYIEQWCQNFVHPLNISNTGIQLGKYNQDVLQSILKLLYTFKSAKFLVFGKSYKWLVPQFEPGVKRKPDQIQHLKSPQRKSASLDEYALHLGQSAL